eukprot:1947723-Amphidinium_carterae.2
MPSECRHSRIRQGVTSMQPHEVLGVPLGAPVDVVRTAYKRAALECHPDKGGSKESGARAMQGTSHIRIVAALWKRAFSKSFEAW